jgi:hypothetical protein
MVSFAVLASGCASGRGRLDPTTPAKVHLTTDHSAVYAGQQIWVGVDWQHAIETVGDEWLVLDFAVTAVENRTAKVKRSWMFVLSPTGQRIAAASQQDVTLAWTDLPKGIRRALISPSATTVFATQRFGRAVDLYSPPTERAATDEFALTDIGACRSLLIFRVPGGTQKGTWQFRLDGEEDEVLIPFTL